jgi:hypothetical protein
MDSEIRDRLFEQFSSLLDDINQVGKATNRAFDLKDSATEMRDFAGGGMLCDEIINGCSEVMKAVEELESKLSYWRERVILARQGWYPSIADDR